jgi:hypothetical protein
MSGINITIKKHLGSKFVSSVDYRDKINLRGHPKFKWYKPDHSGVSYVGVYFLYDKNELVYIGYTADVYKRVANHRSGFFKWTKVRYVDVGDELKARKLEFALLVTNKTKYNSPKYVERRVIKDPYNYWWRQRGILSETVKYSVKRLKPHYQKMLDMSFEEFEEQYKLKMSGEPHDLAII